MEVQIRRIVEASLARMGASDISFVVERPVEMTHGDYTINAALVAAKGLGKNPREVAALLSEELKQGLGEKVQTVEVAGPGFINVTLSFGTVSFLLAEADAQGDEWGKGQEKKGKRICVEYSNPNPFKEAHIGHLMSNVVGEAVSRLIEGAGAQVVRDTFGGDVGPHVAKALWQLRKEGIKSIESAKQIGEAYARGSVAYEENEEAKKEIDALNTRIYEVVGRQTEAISGEDAELLSLWKEGREVSMQEFRRIFGILGTKLDYELFDSDTTEGGLRMVREGLTAGVFEESDGAVIYRGEKQGLHTLVFITSRGTPTYETKDIGLAFLKQQRINAEEDLIVTAVEQVGHFKVVLAALRELAPHLAAKTKHVPHGLLRLPDGKMSSRKGNVITAADLIVSMAERASEKNSDPIVAQQVAIGAIKYMILRQSPGQDIIFDPEKSLSLEGDSGPYLQYALVRAKSVIAQAAGSASTEVPAAPYALERVLIHFPEIVARAAKELSPNLLVTYLTELAGAWNSFYAQERIIGGEYERHKLMLARAFVHTMQNGLRVLGIPAPEKM